MPPIRCPRSSQALRTDPRPRLPDLRPQPRRRGRRLTALAVAAQLVALTLASAPLSPLAAQGRAAAEDRAAAIDAVIERFHETRRLNGAVLVAEGGEVIYQRGVGFANLEWEVPNTPDTQFRIGSVTKQFTAVLVLQLVEEGKLALEGTIRDYLPEYPAPQGDRVTVHHLLNHTSGIPSYTNLPGFMEENTRDPYAPDSLVAVVSGMELEFEPGSEWRYSNSGYFILGAILQRVAGESYDDLLRERLLDPLGLSDTGYDHHHEVRPREASGYRRTLTGYEDALYLDSSVPYAAGMMYSTVEDLFRWDRALAARDERILRDPALWEAMFTPTLADYGYGWEIAERPIGDGGPTVKVIQHGGGIFGFSAAFRRFPDQQNTVIVLDNTQESAGAVAAAITRVLYDQPVELPKASIAERILPLIESSGADAGIQRYHDLKRRSADRYDFSEPELNTLGYHLLERDEIEAAIKVFRLNVEQYPDAWNVYDSLGEGLLAAGDTVGAIQNYVKSVEQNPGNQSGREVLAELGVEVDAALLEGIELPPEVLERYVGTYEVRPGRHIVIRRDGTRLFARAGDQAELELFAASERRFFVRVAPIQLEFREGPGGTIAGVTVHQGGQQMEARRIDG